MQPEDQRAVHDLIKKMVQTVDAGERERISADLETLVMMVTEPEIQWAAPMILRQNNKSYRAYPID